MTLSHAERKVRRQAAVHDVRNGMSVAESAAKHGFTHATLACYVKMANRGAAKPARIVGTADPELLRSFNDKKGDRPAWQCLNAKCSNVATWCCPLGGVWRACELHRLPGDEPIQTPEAMAAGAFSGTRRPICC